MGGGDAVTRYMYINSTRSAHAVERTLVDGKARTVALCGRAADWTPEWPMSFEPKKRVCKWCQMVIEHRAKVMQIRFRTLQAIRVKDSENPIQLPKGAVSVAVTYISGVAYVHFLEVGKVVIKLQWLDHWAKNRPEFIVCINDPFAPVIPTPEGNTHDLPLFEVNA